MVALKKAINEYPQAVAPEKMEEFAEYLVRSLKNWVIESNFQTGTR
jgi:hypothetical protein